ncbi:MAG: hypothetical protein U0842_20485 [Candidatus Binatia bacterium]
MVSLPSADVLRGDPAPERVRAILDALVEAAELDERVNRSS